MTIRVHKTTNYSVIANYPLNDSSLDWECRGLLAYLLSKPDGWQINTRHLAAQSPSGKDKVLRILNDLEGAGYIARVKARGEKGQIEWVSEIFEHPSFREDWINNSASTMSGKSSSGKSSSGKSSSGKSSSGKSSYILNTDSENTELENTELTNQDARTRDGDGGNFLEGDFDQQPTATEQESKLTGKNNQSPLASKTDVEETNFPPLISAENRQQDALVVVDGQTHREGVARVSAALNRQEVIQKAVETYNQYRGQWGECFGLSDTQRNRLDLMLRNTTPDEFLSLVRDATLWAAKDKWLNRPDFDNKNFGFLISRRGDDRLVEYALKWRSLPDTMKVGAAMKISSQAQAMQYCDLDGNPCSRPTAKGHWWDISDRWLKQQIEPTEKEKIWASTYFPGFDLFVGDDNL